MIKTFTTVINKEGKWFVAKCLELGVVSQGKTIEKATKNLKEAVELYLEDNDGVMKTISREASLITSFEVNYV
ncbi:MAG: type II toxin-antitoxin system HicB family antitoxin [Patescibacteria group bacterium]